MKPQSRSSASDTNPHFPGIPQKNTHETEPKLARSGRIWTNLDWSGRKIAPFPVHSARSADSAQNSPANPSAAHHSPIAADLDASVFQCSGRGLVLGSAISSASRSGNARETPAAGDRSAGSETAPATPATPRPRFGTASRIWSSPDPSRRTRSYRSQIAMCFERTCSTRSAYAARASPTTPQAPSPARTSSEDARSTAVSRATGRWETSQGSAPG